jgi:hypothetical protein
MIWRLANLIQQIKADMDIAKLAEQFEKLAAAEKPAYDYLSGGTPMINITVPASVATRLQGFASIGRTLDEVEDLLDRLAEETTHDETRQQANHVREEITYVKPALDYLHKAVQDWNAK